MPMRVVQWLEKHPDGPADVEAIALETVFLVGTKTPETATKLAERLLQSQELAQSVALRIAGGQKNPNLRPLVIAALKRQVLATKSADTTRLLQQLQQSRD